MENNYGEDIQSAIADMLRAERAIQELTMDDMAERTGMPKITLHRYMKGQRDIPLKALATICKALGVPMVEIIDRAEQRLESQQNGQ